MNFKNNYDPLKPNPRKDIVVTGISFSSKRISDNLFFPKLVRFFNKYFYKLPIVGFGASLNRYSNILNFYSASEDKKNYKSYEKNAKFLNLGSGSFSHNKWINLDLPAKTKYFRSFQGKVNKDFLPIDLNDEMLRLPFGENSVELVYLSHVIDHLEDKSINRVFSEIFRVLKPNGILRVVVPFSERDLSNSKSINDQENIPNYQKIKSISGNIRHSLDDACFIDEKKLYEIASCCEFDFKLINEKIINIIDKANIYDESKPHRRINYLNDEKIKSFAIGSGFRFFFPLLKGNSFAKPFLNLSVFDTTEPHYSMYFEIIK